MNRNSSIIGLLSLVCLIGSGCAGRAASLHDLHPRTANEPQFWTHCEEFVPASDDGFSHFRCLGTDGHTYEILVRAEPKK